MRTNFLGLMLFFASVMAALGGELLGEDLAASYSANFWMVGFLFAVIFMADGLSNAVKVNKLNIKIKKNEQDLAGINVGTDYQSLKAKYESLLVVNSKLNEKISRNQ
jgi:hypothetical protein